MERIGDRFTSNWIEWLSVLNRLNFGDNEIKELLVNNAKENLINAKNLVPEETVKKSDYFGIFARDDGRSLAEINNIEDFTDNEFAYISMYFANASIYNSGLFYDKENDSLEFIANIDNYVIFPNLILLDLLVNFSVLYTTYDKPTKVSLTLDALPEDFSSEPFKHLLKTLNIIFKEFEINISDRELEMRIFPGSVSSILQVNTITLIDQKRSALSGTVAKGSFSVNDFVYVIDSHYKVLAQAEIFLLAGTNGKVDKLNTDDYATEFGINTTIPEGTYDGLFAVKVTKNE